jgi:lipoyl(octanoyl) transferase
MTLPVRYTHTLEQVVIDALATLGIEGGRSTVNTGVWIGKNKVCAIGVTASRWVTMHGLALNVSPDLSNYDRIVPCGITEEGCGVCSIRDSKPLLDVEVVADAFLESFSNKFGVQFESRSFSSLQSTMCAYPALASAVLDRKL